ncbi:TPA: hypothetical protein HA225_01490 [Candidatus Micrarchaeota archaeon]|nr:hypothetical protein [Candidatus Micrarchaeota archaeon]
MELISILGIALVVILFFAVFSSGLLTDIGVQQDTKDARNAVQGIAEAADAVFAQGEGASKSVAITIPPSAIFGPNDTFVGKPPSALPSAPSNMVRIRLENNDIYAFSRAPLVGSLPGSPGGYVVNVTSRGSFVTVGAGLVSASPSRVRIVLDRSSTKSAFLTFTILTNETIVGVNVTKDWGFSSPTISITPSIFTSNGVSSMQVKIDAASDTDDAGTYEGALNVSAWKASDNQTQQGFQLPLSVEVRVG